MFGINVKVKFTDGYCARNCVSAAHKTTTLHNITEIHYGYRAKFHFEIGLPIAFESDLHMTGMVYDSADILEYETSIATEMAEAL